MNQEMIEFLKKCIRSSNRWYTRNFADYFNTRLLHQVVKIKSFRIS